MAKNPNRRRCGPAEKKHDLMMQTWAMRHDAAAERARKRVAELAKAAEDADYIGSRLMDRLDWGDDLVKASAEMEAIEDATEWMALHEADLRERADDLPRGEMEEAICDRLIRDTEREIARRMMDRVREGQSTSAASRNVRDARATALVWLAMDLRARVDSLDKEGR